jgi:IS5 family transposase
MTGVAVSRRYVDRGYRGHGADHRRVFVSGQRRGITPTIRRELRHRTGDGHMKTEGRLDRNFLAGVRGDAINALLCGAGYNLRLILNRLTRLLCALLRALAATSPLAALSWSVQDGFFRGD